MSKSSDNQREITLSQYPVTFVQFVFAVVIGASVLYFHELLFPPTVASLNFWALIIAYFTAITSWFGWRESTPKYPYTDSGLGRVRSVLDAAIVVAYVALLFFGSRIDKFLGWYLWSFVIIFFLYFVVGKLRQTEHHDPKASKSQLIIYNGIALVVVAVVYTALSSIWIQFSTAAMWLFVLMPAVSVAIYRWFRDWHNLPWIKRTKRRITIAVDMDGVLVEQVIPVLLKLKKETGVDLCKCDITEWEYPINCTDIKNEIERAEREEQFVREMPPMKNAGEALQILSREYKIVIATSRESSTARWSRAWLLSHSMKYSRFINTRMHGKNLRDADVLIDDYVDNIQEFIRNGPPSRQAILFAQPWNQDTGAISNLISSGQVRIAHSWSTVLAILGCHLPETGVIEARNKTTGNYTLSLAILALTFGLILSKVEPQALVLFGFEIPTFPILVYKVLGIISLIVSIPLMILSFSTRESLKLETLLSGRPRSLWKVTIQYLYWMIFWVVYTGGWLYGLSGIPVEKFAFHLALLIGFIGFFLIPSFFAYRAYLLRHD